MNMLCFSAVFLAFYLWHTFGIAIGYHRLLSHRSFKCSKAVEYFSTFFLIYENADTAILSPVMTAQTCGGSPC